MPRSDPGGVCGGVTGASEGPGLSPLSLLSVSALSPAETADVLEASGRSCALRGRFRPVVKFDDCVLRLVWFAILEPTSKCEGEEIVGGGGDGRRLEDCLCGAFPLSS